MTGEAQCSAKFLQKVYFKMFSPLYSGGLFYFYMLDESICHFRGVKSVLLLFVLFLAQMFSKKTWRYCHSPVVVDGGSVQKL